MANPPHSNYIDGEVVDTDPVGQDRVRQLLNGVCH